MKMLLIILVFQLLQVEYIVPDYASTLDIKNKNCEYSIKIMKGWETIPLDTINHRFGKGLIDAGFYNTKNASYFDGEYIQYIFIPTLKSLNQFSFKQLSDNFSKNVSKNIPKTYTQNKKDTISLVANDFKIDKLQQWFYISGKIKSKIKEMNFAQIVIPAKFGFLKVIRYTKDQGISDDAFFHDIISNTKISDDFKYVESPSKFKLTAWQIVLAFCIGLAVYFTILYLPKIKKKLTSK